MKKINIFKYFLLISWTLSSTHCHFSSKILRTRQHSNDDSSLSCKEILLTCWYVSWYFWHVQGMDHEE